MAEVDGVGRVCVCVCGGRGEESMSSYMQRNRLLMVSVYAFGCYD